jgi:hypothetical protein
MSNAQRRLERIRKSEEWREFEDEYNSAASRYDRAVVEQRWARKHGPGRPLTDSEKEFSNLLWDLDKLRLDLDYTAEMIAIHIRRDPALKAQYERFLKSTGVWAREFDEMIHKGAQSPPVKRRGPLRLVVSNRPKRKGSIPRRVMKTKINQRG